MNNDRSHRRVRAALFRSWFRLTRSMTLGVRGMVIDGENEVLLVRHTYTPGWLLPGGGIERGETAVQSLRRELDEEAAITIVEDEPRLFGLYSNEASFRGDHIALYVVRQFIRAAFVPTLEIREARFFAATDLPANTTDATRRRLAEVLGEAPKSPHW